MADDARRVDIDTSQPAAPAPEAPAADPSKPGIPVQRPDGLPENFNSVADLAQSYQQLQQKLGAQPQAEPQAPTGQLETVLERANAEYNRTGSLSPATRQELTAAGVPEATQDTYMQGLNALGAQRAASIHEAAGGKEQYNQLMEWAVVNLDDADKAAFNAAVQYGDEAAAALAIDGLRQRASGPQLVQGQAPSVNMTGPQPFRSRKESLDFQAGENYRSGDPAFQAEWEQRHQAGRRLGLF